MSADKEAPITFTSPITATLHPDPNNSTTTNPSTFQSDLHVSLFDTCSDSDFGFTRPDFGHIPVVGTVPFYQRHVFLCYKNPLNWPPRIDAAEFDRLPRLLSASLAARKLHFNLLTCLAICEGRDGTETSNGDVLIFPDMIRYRRLTHFDVDTFVEEVLIKDAEWLPGNPEKLKGFYVFVCCHGSRDRRCGVCGPPLVTRFREEVELHGLEGSVSISPCSHVGGHKYAGNVIIFGPSCINGQVTGHWYGYVRPDDVPILLERHVKKGEIVEGLWRGQMGMSEEEQRKAQELRVVNNGGATLVTATDIESNELPPPMMNDSGCGSHLKANGCCQTNGSKSQQHSVSNDKDFNDCDDEAKVTAAGNKYKKQLFRNNGIEKRKICALPCWFENWEREDTYAALAVVCAVVSVGIAYSCCKQL